MTAIEIDGEEPTFLYRLFGADDRLLYVGITGNLGSRLVQHAGTKDWWPEVTRKTALLYPSRAEAQQAEMAAIRDEGPQHNVQCAIAPIRLAKRAKGRPRPVAPELPEPPDLRSDLRLASNFFRFIVSCTEPTVAEWHRRMVTTGASTLKEVWDAMTAEYEERTANQEGAA